MPDFVAGAFDSFADANAAAAELRDSGFVARDVRVTTNPANPDGAPGTSVRDEVMRWPGIIERLIRNLLEVDEDFQRRRQQRFDAVRRGGVVVSVPVHDPAERSIVRAAFYRHRAVELGNVAGGVPIY